MFDRKGIFLVVSWAAALVLLAGRRLPGVLAALAPISFLVHAASSPSAPRSPGSRDDVAERSSS